jgi:transposase
MATTSKSPKRILQVAHQLGKQRLRTYSHRFSPKKFTLPQLFACLVLKEFLRLDYRKLSALLEDAPALAATIELKKIPHFSTFQKAAARLLISRRVQRLLDETIQAATEYRVMRRNVTLAAIDGTGFESRHISAYFVRRRNRACKTGYQTTTYTRFPSANLLCDCHSHMVLGVVAGRGPGPDDPYFQPTLKQATGRAKIGTLLADAGYDSEAAHAFAREQCGTRTIIPATRGRPTSKRLKGYWRNLMKTRFNKTTYGQRWQVETVNSMIKRSMGSALRARTYWSQTREIALRVLTHNVMILWHR